MTSNHTFWLDSGPDLDYAGWLQAGQLRPGDRLRPGAGGTLERGRGRGLHSHRGQDHSFFVGSAWVLVYNASGICTFILTTNEEDIGAKKLFTGNTVAFSLSITLLLAATGGMLM